jgi:MFS family permease
MVRFRDLWVAGASSRTGRIAALIGAYGLFAAGFAMRPIGGVVLGHLGDRLGRRFVLVYTVVLMGLATAAIAVLPSYEKIGVGAPLLLLILRLLQGFSVGGEFTGSVSYLVETAPQHRRGFAGSLANFGSTSGMLLAAAVAAATVTLTSPAQLESWAWRVPFLFGGAIAACGYFLRRRLRETGYRPLPARANDPIPLKQAITLAPGAMICAVLFTSGYGIVNYLTMVFLPVYARASLGPSLKAEFYRSTRQPKLWRCCWCHLPAGLPTTSSGAAPCSSPFSLPRRRWRGPASPSQGQVGSSAMHWRRSCSAFCSRWSWERSRR